MNTLATDSPFGKIHNAFAGLFQQYDSIDDFLNRLIADQTREDWDKDEHFCGLSEKKAVFS